ncbi:hypothetical protein OC845_002111 [Tilletia horrida]|nr:hypothetical protein OC845_002111 [Tilletia horrida]
MLCVCAQVALRDGNVKAVSRANADTSISPHARDDAFPNWAKAVVGGAGAIIVGAGMYFGGKSLVKYLGALERERVDKVSVFPEQVYGG